MSVYAGSDSYESYYPWYVGEASYAPIENDLAPFQPVQSPQASGMGWLQPQNLGVHASVGATGIVGIAIIIAGMFVGLHLWEQYL